MRPDLSDRDPRFGVTHIGIKEHALSREVAQVNARARSLHGLDAECHHESVGDFDFEKRLAGTTLADDGIERWTHQ